MFQIELCECIG